MPKCVTYVPGIVCNLCIGKLILQLAKSAPATGRVVDRAGWTLAIKQASASPTRTGKVQFSRDNACSNR